VHRILWLSNETPDVAGQGGQRRQYFHVAALAEAGHRVTVASLDGPQSHASVAELAHVVRLPSRHRRLLPGRRGDSATDALFSGSHDRVVLAHTESWPTWRDKLAAVRAPLLVDMHNVLSAWHRRQGRSGEATRWARVEAEIARRADAVAVCSERERAALESHPPPTLVLEHGISPREWTHAPTPGAEPVVKLFGNWDWAPNRAGLTWFLEQVWPRVRTEVSIRCEVAGDGTDGLPGPDGLTFTGRVESVPQFLSGAWVVAVPVLDGVGAPVKYAESLAAGVPVIATESAVPGHRDWPGLVSDDADTWVSWIRQVAADPLPHRGRAQEVATRVRTQLSWTRASAPLAGWIENPGGFPT
jgi:glycosyltransferase involved in cell wall biosynthesis